MKTDYPFSKKKGVMLAKLGCFHKSGSNFPIWESLKAIEKLEKTLTGTYSYFIYCGPKSAYSSIIPTDTKITLPEFQNNSSG